MKEEDRYPERAQKREETGISPYGIWGRLERMHMEMNRLFEEALSPFRDGNFFSPLTHSVKEEGENIVVTLEVPGIEAQNMEIDAAENYITVRGEQREERGGDEKDYRFMERRYGSFRTTIPLPKKVRPEAAEASLDNNVLRITAPKKEERQTDTVRVNVKRLPH
jgi:HSP20 family protein